MAAPKFETFSPLQRQRLRTGLREWPGLFEHIGACIGNYETAAEFFRQREGHDRRLQAGRGANVELLLRRTTRLRESIDQIAPWATDERPGRSLEPEFPDAFRYWLEAWSEDLRTRGQILASMKAHAADDRVEAGRPPKAARTFLIEQIARGFEKQGAPVTSYSDSLFAEAVRMALDAIGEAVEELSGILKPYAQTRRSKRAKRQT
jgi:hypothetical protein